MYKYERCLICRRPLKPNQDLTPEQDPHLKSHLKCMRERAKKFVFYEGELDLLTQGQDDDYLEQERRAESLGMTRSEWLEEVPDSVEVALHRAKARLMAIGKKRRLRVVLKLGLPWFGVPKDLAEDQIGFLAPIIFEESRSKAQR